MKFIGICPGHNEVAKGASVGDLNEYDIATRVADSVQVILAPKAIPLIRIPSFPGTAKRSLLRKIDFCNNFGGELVACLEIHYNIFHGSGKAYGTETLISDTAIRGESKTLGFAQIVHRNLVETLETRDRGIKSESDSNRGTLGFLRHIHKPSMILEVGFLTDVDDRKLTNKGGRQKTAQAISRSIEEIIRMG